MGSKKLKRRKWEVHEAIPLELEINKKEYKKMIEVIADIFYQHVCQLQKDQTYSENSIELSTPLQIKDVA